MGSRELTPVEKVMALNRHAVLPDGSLKTFSQQYGEYSFAKDSGVKSMWEYTPFVFSMDSSVFGVPPLSGMPLCMTSASVKHVVSKHRAEIGVLDALATELVGNVLAFQDALDDSAFFFVLDEYSKKGNQYITLVRANIELKRVEVNEVRSVHGVADLDKLIDPALDGGKDFFMSERTGAWLEAQGTRFSMGLPSISEGTRQRLLSLYYTRFPDQTTREDPARRNARAANVARTLHAEAEAGTRTEAHDTARRKK